jgi:hypothetical protein
MQVLDLDYAHTYPIVIVICFFFVYYVHALALVGSSFIDSLLCLRYVMSWHSVFYHGSGNMGVNKNGERNVLHYKQEERLRRVTTMVTI